MDRPDPAMDSSGSTGRVSTQAARRGWILRLSPRSWQTPPFSFHVVIMSCSFTGMVGVLIAWRLL